MDIQAQNELLNESAGSQPAKPLQHFPIEVDAGSSQEIPQNKKLEHPSTPIGPKFAQARSPYGRRNDANQTSRSRTWSTRTLVTTGTLSFLCGALCWHIIGFWSFVSGIVFNPDGPQPMIGAPGSNELITAATTKSNSPQNARTPLPSSTIEISTTSKKAPNTINGTTRPHVSTETLADLLQCAEARKGDSEVSVHACPPMRRRLPHTESTERANRQMDAREAARRLTNGWQTGVATIETGALPSQR